MVELEIPACHYLYWVWWSGYSPSPRNGSLRVPGFGTDWVALQLLTAAGLAMRKIGIVGRDRLVVCGLGRAQRFSARLHQYGTMDGIRDRNIVIRLPS